MKSALICVVLLCVASLVAGDLAHHPALAAASLPDLADCEHTCDGDWVTVAWGGGHDSSDHHHRRHASPDPAFAGGLSSSSSGVNKSTCYGTFSAHWSRPSKNGGGGASGCAKCVGTFTLLRAPCGAVVATCDGLGHHFGRAPHPGGKVAWHGSGSLGVSTMVKAPRPSSSARDKQGGDASGVHSHKHHRRRNGGDGWKTAVKFSADGVWGEGWALKDGVAEEAPPHPSTPAFEAAARAALREAGLTALPGDAAWDKDDAPGLLRRWAAAVRGFAGRALGSDAKITCNGKELRGPAAFLPCVGDLEIERHGTSGHGRLDGSCHGIWSGAALHTCRGLSTTHVRPEDDGGGDEGACPSDWSLRRQCDGKSGAGVRPGGGVHTWCGGRTSGAVLVKKDGGSGGGKHRREEGGAADLKVE